MDTLLHAVQPLFAAAFTLWGSPVSWLEIVAFVLAIVMVVCNMRVNPVAWPLAIASSLLYFLLFWDSRLYGEASLQLLFVAIALWGWWEWLRGTQADGQPLRVRRLSAATRGYGLAALLVLWPATAWLLTHTTDSDVPWWDAFPTAASLIGQVLLGRKYVENWAVWLVVNVVSVTLFVHKSLYLTALLYAVFVIMSAAGWRAWHKLASASK